MSDLLTNTLLTLFGLVGLLALGLVAAAWAGLREIAWLHRRITDLEVAEQMRKGREHAASKSTAGPAAGHAGTGPERQTA